MRFENFIRRGGFWGVLRAVLFALSLWVVSIAWTPCLLAEQSESEITSLLTTGKWTFHGATLRTFNADGTYSSANGTKGTWQINGNELDVSLGRSMLRFNLPLDPAGTQGTSAGGIPQTLARAGGGDKPDDAQPGDKPDDAQPGDKPDADQPGADAPGPPAASAPAESYRSGSAKEMSARLVQTYADSLVFVTGANSLGSAFIASMGNGNFLVTNVHVAAGAPGAELRKLDGSLIPSGSPSMACGEDIFCMSVPAGGKPLPVMTQVESNAAIGDAVVVLGNSDGAGVLGAITGKIVGIGPKLVEVDAPFIPGNSGSPIIHLKTGKVIGVATYATIRQYDATTHLKMRNPQVRHFGYRLDSVKQWQPVNWHAFQQQAAMMDGISTLTDDLDDVLADIAEHRGRLTAGRHTNPAIKDAIDQCCQAEAGYANRATIIIATSNLIPSLKAACSADIAVARRRISYDYFQKQLAEQEEDRDALAKTFDGILLQLQQY